MKLDTLTLEVLLTLERAKEQAAHQDCYNSRPYSPDHVATHGAWQRHKGRRELLETLLEEARLQSLGRQVAV